VLLTCYFLTVVFDMVIAVSIGVVMAALLFMRRTAELTHSRILEGTQAESEYELVPGVALYEIAGPLFFGAAQNAMGALSSVGSSTQVVVLALGKVPSIDATGFVALESAIIRLKASKKRVILAGPLPEPREVFERADLTGHYDHVRITQNLDQAIVLARELVGAESTSAINEGGRAPGSTPAR